MRSSLLQHVLVVASGSLAARLIMLAAMPLLTRLYGPAAFGVLGVFNSALAVLMPLATLSLPVAIVLARDDAEADNMAALVLAISSIVSVATVVLLGAFPDSVYQRISGGLPLHVAPWLGIGIFCTVCMEVMQQLAFRQKMYVASARAGVYQSIAVTVSKCGLGYVNPTAGVLVGISAVAPAVLAVQMALFQAEALKERWRALRRSGLQWRAIGDYRTLVLFRTPQTLINSVSQGAPVFLLVSFDGVAAAGIYALARQMLTLPSMLVGNSVASVYLPHMTERHREGRDLLRPLVKATFTMGAVGAVPFGLIALLAPWLFGIVFGQQWSTSGDYASYLAPYAFMGFMNRPSTSVIPLLRLEAYQLRWEILTGGSRIAALLVGLVPMGSSTAAIVLFSVVGFVANAALIARVIAAARKASAVTPDRSKG